MKNNNRAKGRIGLAGLNQRRDPNTNRFSDRVPLGNFINVKTTGGPFKGVRREI